MTSIARFPFESSGVAAALVEAVRAIKSGETIVQLGLRSDMTVPMQAMIAKDLQLKGSFRFHTGFFPAGEMMCEGRLGVTPPITHRLPFDQAIDAFEFASDRTQAVKINIKL